MLKELLNFVFNIGLALPCSKLNPYRVFINKSYRFLPKIRERFISS